MVKPICVIFTWLHRCVENGGVLMISLSQSVMLLWNMFKFFHSVYFNKCVLVGSNASGKFGYTISKEMTYLLQWQSFLNTQIDQIIQHGFTMLLLRCSSVETLLVIHSRHLLTGCEFSYICESLRELLVWLRCLSRGLMKLSCGAQTTLNPQRWTWHFSIEWTAALSHRWLLKHLSQQDGLRGLTTLSNEVAAMTAMWVCEPGRINGLMDSLLHCYTHLGNWIPQATLKWLIEMLVQCMNAPYG